ncbi:MAG: methyltransferase domain-containing protein [Betaproteobacteria bacterium]
MPNVRPDDSWNRGDPYEMYVGRWSHLAASGFLRWLNLPPSLRWLDVGCGTGALTASIHARCRPARLIGVEPSDGFLTTARERLEGNAELLLGNAMELPLQDSSVDVVVSGLVLNFVPDPAAGVAEMRRKTVVAGTIAAYVWDYAGKMELMRHFWDVAGELNSDARHLDEGVRFPLCRPNALTSVFEDAGLVDIAVAPIEIDTRFRDFDDYWTPFLGGQGPAPSYAMSLDEPSRTRLRDRIRERLPVQGDGSIPLVARAWAVRGRVPA